ncbi:AraC family transcriptional regulator [Acidovorax sacchari]|uniref:AraC family transcriptional regulator n=1 Tax=Acidovorax sacchari TaxID=3230736 RepID=UPI0039E4EC39
MTGVVPAPAAAAPSGAPVLRRSLCQLARPTLATVQHTPRFAFQDATLLQVQDGRLDLVTGTQRLSVTGGPTLLLVDPGTCADLHKTPCGTARRFRSVLLVLDAGLLESFQRGRAGGVPAAAPQAPFRALPLDDDLARTLGHAVDGVGAAHIGDERLHYRLLDLLCALHERGHAFRPAFHHATTRRLRALLGAAPEQRWTAALAGHALAMSEATLRRRLAAEQQRFDALLADVRMQHALMLLQTTGWSIPRIALACGYQSRARFAERFRGRFGYLPSTVR